MISVKSFVIERAVNFITILEEDFPGLTVLHCFHEPLHSRVSVS